jgi:hypothetical protein
VEVRDGELVLALPPGNARNFQNNSSAGPLLRQALSERFGGSWKITVVSTAERANGRIELPPDEPPPVDAEPNPDVNLSVDAEPPRPNDPVAVAMEGLGAQIVDERETS